MDHPSRCATVSYVVRPTKTIPKQSLSDDSTNDGNYQIVDKFLVPGWAQSPKVQTGVDGFGGSSRIPRYSGL